MLDTKAVRAPDGKLIDALESITRQLMRIREGDTVTPVTLNQRHAHKLLRALMTATVAIVDNRNGLGLNAEREEDFQFLYALVGKRVLLVDCSEEEL